MAGGIWRTHQHAMPDTTEKIFLFIWPSVASHDAAAAFGD